MDWNTRVLQDLVYDRARHHVDLISLVAFEHDLAEIVERAHEREGRPLADAEMVTRRLLDEAWRRLEREWRTIRDAECPLCAELYDRTATVS
jgi:hypothetical protein